MSTSFDARNLEVYLRSLNLLRAGIMSADAFEEEIALFASDEDTAYGLLNTLGGWLMGTLESLGVSVEALNEYLGNMTQNVDELEQFEDIVSNLDLDLKGDD